MKARILHSAIFAILFCLPLGHSEDEPQPYYRAAKQSPLSRAGLGALEHASKLVAAINALDWKTAEDALPPTNKYFPFPKMNATKLKDWHGIGAYRCSDYRKEDRTLVHRFTYGSERNHPHEVWFHYSIDGDNFTFTGYSILGW
ncbi:MAG: hypothetical protein QOE70_1416 [Chthoniobacter sp.]|jgi:hypothetical protein|nr:hypothetical protein [Chthoniobacter sp.]